MENHLSSFALSILLLFDSVTLCLGVRILNSATDKNALLSFKNSITSDPHAILHTNWSENSSVCNWFGVTCGLRHQRVTALNLSGFDLAGTVSPHLGNLTFLRYLDISSNHFTYFLPFELSKLRHLKVVNVGFNSFTGDIPRWLGDLPRLKQLYLHNNIFSGRIPSDLCNSMPNINTLYLYENNLEGQIPSSIWKCAHLEFLAFSSNNFSGKIPFQIGSLSMLRELHLGANNFQGGIPAEIGNLSRLEQLDISIASLSGKIPSSIFNISSLRYLGLDSNSLSGRVPRDMCNKLPNVNELALSNNQLSGEIPPNICKCRNLEILSLSINNFTGSIPSQIGSLSMLRKLYLGYNDFQLGGIPTEIGNLSRLELLEISSASLSGNIPSSIFNISSLRYLAFSDNNLSGSIPIPTFYNNLPQLEKLYLNDNKLTGQIPPNLLKYCRNLETLTLENNNLSGRIPREIGNMSMLMELSLAFNHFTGELPQEIGTLPILQIFDVLSNSLSNHIPSSIFSISTLIALHLSINEFSGSLPLDLGHSLFNLKELLLAQNKINGPIPNSIINASHLIKLEMSSNSLSGSIPDFGNLRFLRTLYIGENKLSATKASSLELRFLSSLTNCRHLKDLDVSENPLNGILPAASMGNFSSSLETIWASNSNISGVIPTKIGELSSLLYLDFGGNQLSGPIPPTIGKMKQLQRINLSGNRLVGYIPGGLCRLNNLGELSLDRNMLVGSIPECLGEVKSLRNMYLSFNQLNSTIPPNFWTLSGLIILNLSSNYLSGHLSSQLGNLKVLNSLDLSFNQFSGDIPSIIDGCQSLEILNFSNNQFTGSIPKALGNVKGLTTLDLSHNNLSGFVPKSLEDLHFLLNFSVSDNKLEGEIPSGGRFSNFTAQSLAHNFALCGLSRYQVQICSKNGHGSRGKKYAQLIKYMLPSLIVVVISVFVMLVFIRRRNQNKVALSSEISPVIEWRRVSYMELERGTNCFSESNLLGRGSFGSVFQATLTDGLQVAAKVFNLQLEGGARSFDTETKILSNIRHRNLVEVIGCCSNNEFKAMILTYMPNGSLDKLLYSTNYILDLIQRLKIAIDVAAAFEYLHHGYSFTVVHCDIKPSIVLLDADMIAHLSDFSISKLFEEGEAFIQTQTLATIGYAAPEFGLEGRVSTYGDVYSFGIMLLEMFTGKKPTDDMFGGAMSLKDWVAEALQHNATTETMAAALLSTEDPQFSTKERCVSSIFELAMKCAANSADERINMIEAAATLHKIYTITVAAFGSRRPRYALSFSIGENGN